MGVVYGSAPGRLRLISSSVTRLTRMASRRKSTTPCMVPPQESLDQEMEELDSDLSSSGLDPLLVPDSLDSAEGGYECKYCSFQTPELNLFTVHVDAEHPDVVLNASYVCLECDYHTRR